MKVFHPVFLLFSFCLAGLTTSSHAEVLPRLGVGMDTTLGGHGYVGFYSREHKQKTGNSGWSTRLYFGTNGQKLTVTNTIDGYLMYGDWGLAILQDRKGNEDQRFMGMAVSLQWLVGVNVFTGIGPEGGRVSAGLFLGF